MGPKPNGGGCGLTGTGKHPLAGLYLGLADQSPPPLSMVSVSTNPIESKSGHCTTPRLAAARIARSGLHEISS